MMRPFSLRVPPTQITRGGRRRAFSPLGLCGLLALCGCDVEPGEPRLVEVRAWQPLRLAQGEGDLLSDALTVEVTLRVDGVSDTLALSQDLDVVAHGALAGRFLELELRTHGDRLADAEGRTSALLLGDETELVMPMVVAPPDLEHLLVDEVPPAREGFALCAASDGRTFLLGGREEDAATSSGFVVDPLARQVRPAPWLPSPRVGASCFLAEDRLYVLGGCDGEGAPSPALWRTDDDDDDGGGWTVDEAAPSGGCHSAAARLTDGRFVLVNETEISLYDPATRGAVTTSLHSPRRSPVLVAFEAEGGTLVAVGGGFDVDGATGKKSGAELLHVEGAALLFERTLDIHLGAAVAGGESLYLLDGGALRRLGPGGALASLPTSMSLPTHGASLTWTTQNQLAALIDDGTKLGVWSAKGLRLLDVNPPRPGGQLVSLPGGTLLLLGGGHAGVAVFVIDDVGLTNDPP